MRSERATLRKSKLQKAALKLRNIYNQIFASTEKNYFFLIVGSLVMSVFKV